MQQERPALVDARDRARPLSPRGAVAASRRAFWKSRRSSTLVNAGVVVIACGGGGIPVAWQDDRLVGVEGVVDKDLASSLLATRPRRA